MAGNRLRDVLAGGQPLRSVLSLSKLTRVARPRLMQDSVAREEALRCQKNHSGDSVVNATMEACR